MNKLIRYLDLVEEVFLVLGFSTMVSVIFLQVIMRFIFNNSLSWSEELGKFLFVWISWIGISIGHKRKEHIKITLLVEKFPKKFKIISEMFSEIVLIIICGITLYYSVYMMTIQIKVPYAGIKISTSWGYLSVVLGCGLFIIRSILIFLETLKSLKNEEEIA